MSEPIKCEHCGQVHSNPIIDLFETHLRHCPPPSPEVVYDTYLTGFHDCLALLVRISVENDDQAERLLNGTAIQLRNAMLDRIPPDERAKCRAMLNARFMIHETRRNDCGN